MSKNDDLKVQLNKSLLNITAKLGTKGVEVCARELKDLRSAINRTTPSEHSFFENRGGMNFRDSVLKCMQGIIKKIDQEVSKLENEMHGVQNYSSYELERVKGYGYKTTLQTELKKVLHVMDVKEAPVVTRKLAK